jgi:uncharacterized protein YecA (UPF0149 family)
MTGGVAQAAAPLAEDHPVTGSSVEFRRPKAQGPSSHAKVGRNDDCPCGSGKKYKKCCG